MKKLLFLLAFVSLIGMDVKADATFTNNTNCDLTIEVWCINCFTGFAAPTFWGTHTVAKNGGTINIPGILSCGNGETRVAKLCYADCPGTCATTFVNLQPGGIPAAPEGCGISDTYTFPGSLCTCANQLSLPIYIRWVDMNNFVASTEP